MKTFKRFALGLLSLACIAAVCAVIAVLATFLLTWVPDHLWYILRYIGVGIEAICSLFVALGLCWGFLGLIYYLGKDAERKIASLKKVKP